MQQKITLHIRQNINVRCPEKKIRSSNDSSEDLPNKHFKDHIKIQTKESGPDPTSVKSPLGVQSHK